MKKIFLLLILMIFCFITVGCKKEQNTLPKDVTPIDGELEAFSDDTKIVFKDNNSTHIFYYDKDIITSHITYIDYATNAIAQAAYEATKLNSNSMVKRAYVNGKYLVFEWKESEYNNMTVEKIRLSYSNMKELIK